MSDEEWERIATPITFPGEWTVVEGEQFTPEERDRILAKLDAIDEAQGRAVVASRTAYVR